MTEPVAQRRLRGRRVGSPAGIALQVVYDSAAWIAAVIVAVLLRFDFNLHLIAWRPLALVCTAVVVLQILFGWIYFLYRGRHPNGSFAEVLALLSATASTGMIVGISVFLFGNAAGLPRSILLLAFPVAFVLMGAVRYLTRVLSERAIRPVEGAEFALIYGAGYLGDSIVKRMLTDRTTTSVPNSTTISTSRCIFPRRFAAPMVGRPTALVWT